LESTANREVIEWALACIIISYLFLSVLYSVYRFFVLTVLVQRSLLVFPKDAFRWDVVSEHSGMYMEKDPPDGSLFKSARRQANKFAKVRLTSSSPVYIPIERSLLGFPKEAFQGGMVTKRSWNLCGEGPDGSRSKHTISSMSYVALWNKYLRLQRV
jgi:hypothetical protein